ncbi:hypothetical protein [Bacteroides helcogenes]|uniref:Uncharacterized protein n=1 Tax=Bacteroides helcogenes (strain ATCC 35417 / DSM 20613 / JCM 6297 / CCUG 15421 / P 36-108) TaxID=693979 RepID=E6SVN9_BACT6|nr:hypothetical protein [Bacteroides helcogenes]ADV43500.1 hypothetical protein Bache_1495 [Bacteroides helcogenes P 36-108]
MNFEIFLLRGHTARGGGNFSLCCAGEEGGGYALLWYAMLCVPDVTFWGVDVTFSGGCCIYISGVLHLYIRRAASIYPAACIYIWSLPQLCGLQ